MRFEIDEAVQMVRAESAQEITQLKETVGSLRSELERLRVTYEDELQTKDRQSRDEAADLQRTIEALRQELEASHAE